MAGALGRGGNEHFRAGDDLVAAGMMLADPGLVIVQPVEMDQKLHVALERQQRVFAERMERREENACFQESVLHGLSSTRGLGHRSITDRRAAWDQMYMRTPRKRP